MEYNGITLTEDMVWALGVTIFVSYVIRAFYCHTLKKTLDLISEENQCLKPKMAWLAIIPLFSLYWNFIIASRMADSLTNEFYDRKIPEEEDPGKKIGTIYAVFVLLASFPLFQSLALVSGIFSIIYFIRYWIKINNFRTLLEEHNNFKLQKEHEIN